MGDWFDTGPYVPEPLTEKQRGFLQTVLQHQQDKLLEMLSDEERVALELMGAEEWLTCLSKWYATELISSILRQENAAKTRRREAQKARKAATKPASPSQRKPAASPVRRKWWSTQA